MLRIEENNHCACLIERKSRTLLTMTILPKKERKKLNLAKAMQYKVSQTFATFLQYIWQNLPCLI